MQRAYTQDGGKKQYAIPNTQNPVSHPNEIRNKLKVNKMGALGTQLARAINSVFLDVDDNTYDNLIRMGQALQVTRTSNGAIFPAAGGVETINLVDDTLTKWQPGSGQCINIPFMTIHNGSPDTASTVTISLTDGTNSVTLYDASVSANTRINLPSEGSTWGAGINLNSAVYLSVIQTASVPTTIAFGYDYTVYDGGSNPVVST